MKISESISIKEYQTFGFDTQAKYFCSVHTRDELIQAIDFVEDKKLSYRFLGAGSNCLFIADYQGLLIKLANKGIEVLQDAGDQVKIRVAAGENWHQFVLYSLERAWFGLQNLSLIPGSVGAAPIQNIGAYGEEVGTYILGVECYHIQEKRWFYLEQQDCRFGYRDSIFKQEFAGKVVIWSVDFQLCKKAATNTAYGDIMSVLSEKGISHPTPKDVSDAVIEIRKRKLPDPAEIGNAGSFFKNPTISAVQFQELKQKYPEIPGYVQKDTQVKVPAGWLIEQAGWKGYTDGPVGVHRRQALVLVHYGGGKGEDIWALAQHIMEDVKAKFGVSLQPEVNII